MKLQSLEALALWSDVVTNLVRKDGHDLSQRQLALLLMVYLTPPPHTVRGIAGRLNISKPAVTRALDTLSIMGLIKRKRDPSDKRNVLIQRTVKGSMYLSELSDEITGAAARLSGEPRLSLLKTAG
jgi:DNA-binding MarR family transcriptional regulator